MALIKLTKNELREQQNKLGQLEKYLPTLQLKKAMLQQVVNEVRQEVALVSKEHKKVKEAIDRSASLFSDELSLDIHSALSIKRVLISEENIAGVEVPVFEEVEFAPVAYSLFDTPVWIDSALDYLKELLRLSKRIEVLEQKKKALEKELNDVSIRVNLFEKILIPRAKKHIKTIKVFLSDQQLAAVCQAKVAKKKIKEKKEALAGCDLM